MVIVLLPVQVLSALTVSVRELARISFHRENQVSGYGVVVGLNGTGDSRADLAIETLRKNLYNRGIEPGEKALVAKNIAAVMVTAIIPPHARPGDPIDIWVSSIGDARALNGGQLLQTPLTGADGQVYAVAQGPISAPLPRPVENNNLQLYNFSVYNRRIPPADRLFQERHNSVHVPHGAIVERAVTQPTVLIDSQKQTKTTRLSLYHFDFLTARNVVAAINKKFPKTASLADDGTIAISIPYDADHVDFLAKVLAVKVEVPERTRVVVDTRTGTIISGGGVAISAVMVTHNGMRIEIKKRAAYGDEPSPASAELREGATVKELVDNLNRLGLTAAEIIDVLKAIHAAGALHGELVVL
ncbi:MAG: flagellar basal body P-ring protein FlgI [Leptospiraceae bacterium]|nr:flagellar basal body P-ring protein FlgI [Leptospiraceae bacterium]